MIKCQVCGYDNPAESRVCLNCGSPIETRLSEAIDDISGEATVLIGMVPKSVPMAPPPVSAAPPPPPLPAAPRSMAPLPPPPMAGSNPLPPPPTSYSAPATFGNAPVFAPPPGAMDGSGQKNPLAIASLSTGIFALIFSCCCGLFALPLSAAAIITGFLAKKQIAESGGTDQSRQFALIGMILGAVAMVLSVIFIIFGAMINLAQLTGGGAG